MPSIEINKNIWFCADAENKKIRLSLNDGREDLACRREFPSKLLRFIDGDDGHLFKGRLQLYKEVDMISILFKGQPMGQLNATNFSLLLNRF